MRVSAQIIGIIEPILRFLYNLPFIGYYLDLCGLFITAHIVRFSSGYHVANGVQDCNRPEKLLKLYEYEGCPFCRKVRETLCVLDLDAIVIPCPRETFKSDGFVKDSRYRAQAKQLGGTCKFPLLVDENKIDDDNKPLIMYESDKINEYLWQMYGDKAVKPRTYILGSTKLSFLFLYFSSILRSFPEHGLMRIPSKKPKQMLELWSFEPSLYCKKVREILSCLEIAYILRNAAHGSREKRKEFKEKYGDKLSDFRKKLGMIQVPLLIDPNTGTQMFESEDIKQYLIQTYQDGEFKPTESVKNYVNDKKEK